MTAHVFPRPLTRPRSPRETAIRALARENPTVAACIGLVDQNGHPWSDAIETLVLELARINRDLRGELIKTVYRATVRTALPDRTDEGECIVCREVDCAGHEGGAA